jgi:hypothetical protein
MFILYILLAIYLALALFTVVTASPQIGFLHSIRPALLWPVGVTKYWLHRRKA